MNAIDGDDARMSAPKSRLTPLGGESLLGMPKRGKHAMSPGAAAPDVTPVKAQAEAGGTPRAGGNPEDGINQEYNLVIHDAISSIKAHVVFSGVEHATPLSMDNNAGGAQAPFSSTDFQNAMNGAGHYVCGGNFWWQDPLYTPCPGVPMNVTCVEKMSSHLFAEPAPFPVMMTVGVSVDSMPDTNFGALPRCLPEEFAHAFILAVHRDIKAGVGDDVLQAWRRVMLSVPYRFEHHSSREKIFFRAFALREELVTSHAVVARTAYQRIYEISRFKAMAEQDMGRVLSAADVASVYRERASSCGGETFTPGFVDNALTVHERAFRLPEIRQMIVQLEDLCGTASPFNSVTKLHFIVKRAKPPSPGMSLDDAMVWLFGWVVDAILSKAYSAEDLTVRVLAGEPKKQQSTGALSLAMMKLSLLRHILEVLLPATSVEPDVVRLIGSKMSNHVEYRRNYGAISADVEVDSTWQGTLPESARIVLEIIEASQNNSCLVVPCAISLTEVCWS